MRPRVLLACALLLGALATTSAQELAGEPALTTTSSLREFEARSRESLQEISNRVTSIQATLAETRTATVPGLQEALQRQLASSELLRGVLGRQLAALQQAANLVLSREQVEDQLEKLRGTGPSDAGPYPLPRVDQARRELETERARAEPLERSVEAADRSLREARAGLEQARAATAAARLAAEANTDPTRTPTMAAELQAAELAQRVARQRVRLRELDLETERLQLTVHQLRLQLLEERLQWHLGAAEFPEGVLDSQLLELDKEIFDLQRALDTARLEQTAAEQRWAAARARLDQASEPDDVAAEEVQTRFQELQTRQREVVLLEARIQRAEERKEAWRLRFRVFHEVLSQEELPGVSARSQETLDDLSRQANLQDLRLVELRRDVQAVSAHAEASTAPRLTRTLRERQRLLERLVRAGQDNLASIEAAADLWRRLLTEVRIEERTLPVPSWLERLLLSARSLWESELRAVAEIGLHVLLLLFLGLPLNYLISQRAQTVVTRLYNPQNGMIAGKILYYGGMALLLILFLNALGVGLTPLLGAAGITGVALGFASQTSVSNMISGLFLIAEQPFQVDDIIVVGDITGMVLSIDLLSVKIRQFDNRFVRIPNETIIKTNVVNISKHPIRRVATSVQVAYKSDLEQVTRVLLEEAADHPNVLENPAPLLIFQGFKDSGVEFTLCAWGVREDFLKLLNEIPVRVKARFDAEGIEIPFPHLSLYRGEASRPLDIRLMGADGEPVGEALAASAAAPQASGSDS